MTNRASALVVDAEGLSFRARLEPDPEGTRTVLELTDGTQVLVPTELLETRPDGRYDLRLRLREYAAQTGQGELGAGLETGQEAEGMTALQARELPPTGAASPAFAAQGDLGRDEDAVITLAEESLRVGKRTVERSRVVLRKTVSERTETVDVPLTREAVEVERVAVGRPVEKAEGVRYEGDTVIIPRYEEVLVVSTQLVLVEELRVTRRRSEHREPQAVVLRREELSVERADEAER